MSNKEFFVRHGLVVNNTVLTANVITNKVGIGTNTAAHTLDVIGDANISLPQLFVAGSNVLDTLRTTYATTNAAYDSSNSNWAIQNAVYDLSNTIYASSNSNWNVQNAVYDLANTIYASSNSNWTVQNAIYDLTNTVYASANSNWQVQNAVYDLANTIYASSNSNWTVQNAVYDLTNTVYASSNSNWEVQNLVYATVNANYTMANAAYTFSNSAYASLNSNWEVQNLVYATVNANYTMANAGYTTLNAAYDTINADYAFTNSAYASINSNWTVQNLVYSTVNANYTMANAAYNTLNAAYNTANAIYASQNIDFATANAAYMVANAAYANANAVAIYANNWANLVGDSANSYAGYLVNSSNSYADATYLKLISPSQTITGDLSITGNVYLLGNATSIAANNIIINDPLIYLAANNDQSDILDIGFVGHYSNGTANLHTGLYRDHASKQYYLFVDMNGPEPETINDLVPYANGMINAVLHTDLISSNIFLGGANAILTISGAFDKANAAYNNANVGFAAANAYSDSVGVAGNNYASILAANNAVGANAWANTVGTAGNNYTDSVGTAGNNYASILAANNALAGNNYADTVGTSANNYASILAANNALAGNNYTNSVGLAGNNYTNTVGAAGNNYASILVSNTAAAINANVSTVASSVNNYINTVGTAGNNYASILAANNALAGNNYTNSVGLAGNNYTNTLGTAGNNYTNSVGLAGNNYASVLVANNAIGANNWANTKLSNATGTLAGSLTTSGSLTANGYVYILPSDGIQEGGEIQLSGASNYAGWSLDVYQNNHRTFVRTGSTLANVTYFHALPGGSVRMAVNRADPTYTLDVDGTINAAVILLNGLPLGAGSMDYVYVNTSTGSSNSWANAVGTAGNNYASILAANNALAGNNYTNTVGAAVNNYVISVATSGNNYAKDVGTAGNNYASILIANNSAAINSYATVMDTAGNNYTNSVGLAGNNYTVAVGTAGNSYAQQVGAATNSYAQQVGAAANAYTSATYVKLSSASSQLITSDIGISGNLTISGTTTFANTQQLQVGDNIITLNAELPISVTPLENSGIEINRGNKNSNATFLWIESTGQWGFTSNNAQTISTFVASNTLLEQYATAGNNYASILVANNSAAINSYATVMDTAGNNYASVLVANVASAINSYATVMDTAGNNYASVLVANVAAAINSYATVMDTAGNNYTNSVGTAGNNYTNTVGASANAVSATKVATVAGTSGRITSSGTTAITLDLATAGPGAGSYSSGISALTLDAYGRVTAITGSAGYVVSGGALGTPSSGTLTNCTFPTLNQNTTGSAYYGFVQDTRASTTGPNLGDKRVQFDFKTNTTDGLSDGGTYHGVMTFQQWTDGSGGGTRQLGFTDNDNLWIRGSGTGITTYGSWKRILDSSSIGSYATTGVTAGTGLSGGGTVGALTLSLATSGVTAQSYGSATNIPILTIDTYGRVTAAANVAVQGMDYAYANNIGASANAWANTKTGGGAYVGNNGQIGAGFGDIFRVHSNTLSTNAYVNTGNNAIAAGPLTIAAGQTLTINTGATVVIV